MRVAKVVSWIAVVAYGVPTLMMLADYPASSPAALFVVLPMGMALAVYYAGSFS
jgi:hypothetical protein